MTRLRVRTLAILAFLLSASAGLIGFFYIEKPKFDSTTEMLTRVGEVSPFAKGVVNAALIANPEMSGREAGLVANRALALAHEYDHSDEFVLKKGKWQSELKQNQDRVMQYARQQGLVLVFCLFTMMVGFILLALSKKIQSIESESVTSTTQKDAHADENI